MTGNQARTQLWLLIENCTTRLYLLLAFIVNLQGTLIVHVCNQQNIWVLPWAVPPPHAAVGMLWFNAHHIPRLLF